MVFVYAPTILIVLEDHFTLSSFLQVSLTCAMGVFAIATAVSAYYRQPLNGLWRLMMAVGGLLLVAPSTGSDMLALVLIAPVVAQQFLRERATIQTL